jgi:hypothetical protein
MRGPRWGGRFPRFSQIRNRVECRPFLSSTHTRREHHFPTFLALLRTGLSRFRRSRPDASGLRSGEFSCDFGALTTMRSVSPSAIPGFVGRPSEDARRRGSCRPSRGVEIRVGGEGDNALVLVESDLAAVEGGRPDVGVDVRASNLPVAAGFSQPALPRTQVVKIAVLSLVTMVVSTMSNGARPRSFRL